MAQTKFSDSSTVGALGLSVSLLIFFGAGCGGEKESPAATEKKAKQAVAKTENKLVAAPVARRSVFTLDQNSRDPFFPQAKKTPANAVAVATVAAHSVAAADIPALLSAGLQGIGGTPAHRIALINNVMLEPGRSTVIPIRVGTDQRKLSVKCKEVARNSVALEVEGYGLLVVTAKETL